MTHLVAGHIRLRRKLLNAKTIEQYEALRKVDTDLYRGMCIMGPVEIEEKVHKDQVNLLKPKGRGARSANTKINPRQPPDILRTAPPDVLTRPRVRGGKWAPPPTKNSKNMEKTEERNVEIDYSRMRSSKKKRRPETTKGRQSMNWAAVVGEVPAAGFTKEWLHVLGVW